MRVSFRGLYALKALLHLAANEDRGLVKIHEIAEAEEIPEKFLEAILLMLKNARLVASRRGREGGYRLRRPASEVTIGEVSTPASRRNPATRASSTSSSTCGTRPPRSWTTRACRM